MGTNRTPKRVRYRRRVSGVRTALRNVFGTGDGPLGYEPHSKRVRYRRWVSGVRTALRNVFGTGEGPLGGTNRTPKRVRYRRRASGVRTALRNVFGTGEGSLEYEPHSETCSVQEKGLWGTNYSPEQCGTGEGPLGYEPHSETCSVQEMGLGGTNRTPKRVRYRRWVSGVQNESKENAGTRET